MPRRRKSKPEAAVSIPKLLAVMAVVIGFPVLSTLPVEAWYALAAIVTLYVVWRFWRRANRWQQARTLDDLLKLTPYEFEEAIASYLESTGFRNVRLVGGAGDLAADITCTDRKGRFVVVQCKRYQPTARIGSPEIQKFIGMVSVHHAADYGIFVTTASYSNPATQLADEHGIELIDGEELSRLLRV